MGRSASKILRALPLTPLAIAALLTLVALWPSLTRAQDDSEDAAASRDPATLALAAQDVDAAREAASRSLRLISALAQDPVAPKLGFRHPDEVRQVELGKPIPVFTLNLDEIQSYEEGDDPSELLSRSGKMYFPVLVAGEVRTSVTVEEDDGAWEMTSIGQSHLSETLVLMCNEVEGTYGGPTFVAHIPALYQMFVVYGLGEDRRFVPVYANRLLKIVARQIRPSRELFKLLRGHAREFASPLEEGAE